jgi:hypothetical protein
MGRRRVMLDLEDKVRVPVIDQGSMGAIDLAVELRLTATTSFVTLWSFRTQSPGGAASAMADDVLELKWTRKSLTSNLTTSRPGPAAQMGHSLGVRERFRPSRRRRRGCSCQDA